MSATALRSPKRHETPACEEHWISAVEPCAEGWMFSVIGPDGRVETFVQVSQHAAECARTAMFHRHHPAVAVVCPGE